VIQKNELYFCNQGSNVIQNQLSKSKHQLKSFVLQACVILIYVQRFGRYEFSKGPLQFGILVKKSATDQKRWQISKNDCVDLIHNLA
jgi:hypothetical protein